MHERRSTQYDLLERHVSVGDVTPKVFKDAISNGGDGGYRTFTVASQNQCNDCNQYQVPTTYGADTSDMVMSQITFAATF